MTTVIYDTIHEDIVIENRLIVDLINTKEFQRLRHIKQLSTASFTFPDAEHTRFGHSVGVMSLAKKLEVKSFTLSRDNLCESMETFTNYVIGLIEREVTFATEVDGKYVSDQTIDQAFDKIRNYV